MRGVLVLVALVACLSAVRGQMCAGTCTPPTSYAANYTFDCLTHEGSTGTKIPQLRPCSKSYMFYFYYLLLCPLRSAALQVDYVVINACVQSINVTSALPLLCLLVELLLMIFHQRSFDLI